MKEEESKNFKMVFFLTNTKFKLINGFGWSALTSITNFKESWCICQPVLGTLTLCLSLVKDSLFPNTMFLCSCEKHSIMRWDLKPKLIDYLLKQ